MRLLVDCGNSLIKVVLVADGDRALDDSDVQVLEPHPEPVAAALAAVPEIPRLALMQLGNAAHGAVFQGGWQTVMPDGPRLLVLGRDRPLPAVGQYQGLGEDRILAGLAGIQAGHGVTVVVNAGTATTIDAWRPDPALAGGIRFLGGLILPGAQTCLDALRRRAPRLPAVEVVAIDTADPLRHDTISAMGTAVGIGYPAMVAACVDQVRAHSGAAQVILGGGAAAALSAAVAHARLMPHLVLAGMASLDISESTHG